MHMPAAPTIVTTMNDISADLAAAVRAAPRPLRIVGSGSRDFYGRIGEGEALDVSGHRGIVAYEPTELVITACAGTRLSEIEAALATQQQMLGFEPPYFGDGATLGGTIACGISGPRRPYSGSARDFVLGTRIINGNGEILTFGGQVMKNVAGYDVSRLMVGALGTLGVLLEVSLKVVPRPEQEITLAQMIEPERALTAIAQMNARPVPLGGCCYGDGILYIRLAGAAAAVAAARAAIGGDVLTNDAEFWRDLREQRLEFFGDNTPLWRLSLPPAAPAPDLPGRWWLDWGGAQRWLKTDAPAASIFDAARALGGHATLFRGGDRRGAVFQPLSEPLAQLHRQLKHAFDPRGVLNRGRLLAGV